MARNITRFADRTFFHTVDPSLLDRLLAPYDGGYGIDLASLPEERAAHADALFELFQKAGEDFPIALHEALFAIMRLDHPNGMAVLRDLAAHDQIDLVAPADLEISGDAPPVTPRHLALKAYLDHRELFDTALDMLAFVLPRAPLRCQGLEEHVRPVPEGHPGREQFRGLASKYFRSRYRGEYCRVKWFDEVDELNVLVEHGKHLKTILRERQGKEEPLTFHEIRCSTISYDIMLGFVKITGEDDRDKQKLKELFARHVLRRPDFFDHADSRNLYTLDPVVEAGPSFQLERGPDETLTKWVIREIHFDEGERTVGRRKRRPRWGHTAWHVGNAVAQLGESMPDLDWKAVRFTYMKIELEFLLDGRKRRTLVTVKPPGILRGPQGRLEPRILAFLRHNGLCQPRRAPAAAAAAD